MAGGSSTRRLAHALDATHSRDPSILRAQSARRSRLADPFAPLSFLALGARSEVEVVVGPWLVSGRLADWWTRWTWPSHPTHRSCARALALTACAAQRPRRQRNARSVARAPADAIARSSLARGGDRVSGVLGVLDARGVLGVLGSDLELELESCSVARLLSSSSRSCS